MAKQARRIPYRLLMAISGSILSSAYAAHPTPQGATPPVVPATNQTIEQAAALAPLLPGFHYSPWFHEQAREEWFEPGVRVLWNAPHQLFPDRPTRLIVYATPNGNTAEQTLGCALAPHTDFHVDIQHIAAQTRRLREVTPGENIVLACVQPDTLSWPVWRQRTPDNPARLHALLDRLMAEAAAEAGPGPAGVPPVATPPLRVTLTGHSGGGSFLWGFLNGAETIPAWVDRIAFLDANYSYSDTDRHGDKMLAWLGGDPKRRLIVIAYDDRNITLNGKKILGADGGTFRASHRMLDRFRRERTFTDTTAGAIETLSETRGQILFHLDLNPENKILHTALVGDKNGFLEAMTALPTGDATEASAAWGVFDGPRAYSAWVQPAPGIPDRPADAIGGAAFMARIGGMTLPEREAAIAAEICRGNIPPFLRAFRTITVSSSLADPNAPTTAPPTAVIGTPATAALAAPHAATIDVLPDYLAIGSDTDFVRVPMTPMTAQTIADAFECSLITRKLSDDIYRQADLKLEPRPLTEAREAVATFARHNALIETQRAGKPLGPLVAGIKKDVVLTNRLREKPDRVALYGWHKSDGAPIQPLTTIHARTYVDYSHGIRLVRRTVLIDGRPHDLHAALHDSALCALFSDEGPISVPSY